MTLLIQSNWVFATNSDFLITISLKPNVVDLRYFKLWILLNQIWNVKGLQHRVLKILGFKYLILLHRLNSFSVYFLPMSHKAIQICKILVIFEEKKLSWPPLSHFSLQLCNHRQKLRPIVIYVVSCSFRNYANPVLRLTHSMYEDIYTYKYI